jgi:transposase
LQYVGLDVHKKFTQAIVLDDQGNKLKDERFASTIADLDKFIGKLGKDIQIAMEASSVWQHLYEYLEDECHKVKLAHPLKTRLIAEARIKTDSRDAETLANLLRADLIAESYVPHKHARRERQISRHRASLVDIRTMIKNKIHAILRRHGIKHEFSDLFGKAGIEFLRTVRLPVTSRFELDQYIVILRIFDYKINETSNKIELFTQVNPSARKLMEIPGISYYSALMIMAEIGDIGRFSSSKKLCSYAGLVPSTYQSGETVRHGRITKQGSRWMRRVLIQSANVAIRYDKILGGFYKRIERKKGHNKAIVATARKMLKYIYIMLTLGINYEAVKKNVRRAGATRT